MSVIAGTTFKQPHRVENGIMSEYEALQIFNRKRIDMDMIQYLSDLTESIVKRTKRRYGIHMKSFPSLVDFIATLVTNSRVGTSILMSTSVYLNRLQRILPENIVGMETTRHRLFLGCLIIAAKTLNDNSPMNKHWCKHSNGLLSNKEINTVERELLSYLQWDVVFSTKELCDCLRDKFLIPIRLQMYRDTLQTQIRSSNNPLYFNNQVSQKHILVSSPPKYHNSHNMSIDSIPSMKSRQSISSINSNGTSIFSANERKYVSPVQSQDNSMETTSKPPIYLNHTNTNTSKPVSNIIDKKDHEHTKLTNKFRKSSWSNIFHIK
ncbi:PHO85 cyclin-2 [Monosporozyma servazzii]